MGMATQYMLYFEEFLNDLCIQTDVNVRKDGMDTILSVNPKNKDEALEKIANALKIYLTSPVWINSVPNISLEEKMNMETALKKLHAECMHLDSQLTYKSLMIQEQSKKLDLKGKIIDETKRLLVEAGIDTNIITKQNTVLLESLKSIKINGKETKKKTFLNSLKLSLKNGVIGEASFEIGRDKL